MKLYDYIDVLNDEWVMLLYTNTDGYGVMYEIETNLVKEEFNNDNILKIDTDYSPNGDYNMLTFVRIDGTYNK